MLVIILAARTFVDSVGRLINFVSYFPGRKQLADKLHAAEEMERSWRAIKDLPEPDHGPHNRFPSKH